MIVDYSELADTGYVPTAFEYSHIRVGAEEQRHELASIDEEIATLENRLSHLRAYRIKLWRSCTSSAGLMAPIRRLPPEILGNIFVMSLPSISWQEIGDEGHWFFKDEVDPYQAHSAIQSVCRHWSAVLAETPRMWSTIIIRYPLLKIAQIEKMIHRSKSCLLDVYLGTIAEQPIKSIVERNAARLRLICVESLAHGHLFQNHNTVELPNLQYFSTPFNSDPVRLPQIIQAPKLSFLRIRRDGIDSFKDSLSTLRCLVFCNMAFTRTLSTISNFEILKHCPNLQFLDWRDHRETPQMTNDASQTETIHLPLLEVLKVTLSHFPAQGIFLCPCAPKLKFFSLSSPPAQREWTPTALHLLLRMEASHLCRLSLHGVRCTDDYEFGSLLNCFPSLTTLCLDRCTIGPIFFPSSTQDPILSQGPGLKTLHLRCTTFSASNLAKFVRSHTVPDSIRTLRTHSVGLQEVLIEQWRYMPLEAEKLQLIRLHEEYGEVVQIQRTTCGNHVTSTMEEDTSFILTPIRSLRRG
ncbi:hypothetical protein K439DRAFT_1086510 [Ramaria rubella]|nr:hypothetical protein K439DRAFT_1086510 [Ramaria rubella]